LKNSKRFEYLDKEVKMNTPGHPNTPTGKTASRNADILVRDLKTREIIQIETKTGNATCSPSQASKDVELSTGGTSSKPTTWGTSKAGPFGGKGNPTGPIRTVEVTVDPATGKILR